MDIQGFFTKKGLALSAKLAAGSTLRITRVLAGSGQTADPLGTTVLPQIRQTLAVNAPVQKNNTAVIPATLVAATASEDYTLTELGLYAQDPYEGEILYKVYKLEEAVDITAGSRMVLRFYLEETVSQDLGVTVDCSPSGLLTEAEFDTVRNVVEAKTVQERTIHLAAGDLQSYLDSLPRLLTEHLTLYVSGTLAGRLLIRDFYGSGSLHFRAEGDTLGQFVIRGNVCVGSGFNGWNSDLRVGGTSVTVFFHFIRFEENAGNIIDAYGSAKVFCMDCAFAGATKGIRGICAFESAHALAKGCTLSGLIEAAHAEGGATVTVEDCTCEDNLYGGVTYRGGIIFIGGTTPETLGGEYLAKSGGGIIVSTSGTLL